MPRVKTNIFHPVPGENSHSISIEVVPARTIPSRMKYDSVIEALLNIKADQALKIPLESHRLMTLRQSLSIAARKRGIEIGTRYSDGFLYVQKRAG